jgi:hypothetical protein
MTLDAAIKDFERLFFAVKDRPERNSDLPLVWSGGMSPFEAMPYPPVLYSDQEHAISAWRPWAMAAKNEKFVTGDEKMVLEWFQRPELIEYQITIADKRGMHRAVKNRWAVKSQFQVTNG